MFGVSLDTYTLFHTAEDAAACPYLYEKRPCHLQALDYDGTLHQITMQKQDGAVPRRFRTMDRVLEKNALLQRVRVGLGELLFIGSSRGVHEFLLNQLKTNPYFLVAERYPRPGEK
jgi:aminoglycoside N3'-acetyltransferase